MLTRCIRIGAAALALASSPVLAQATKRAPAATPPAAASAPKPDTTGAATAAVASKINLNTATVAELGKLPKISPVQSKAIMEARAKARFKNWDDFVARKLLPADSRSGIKDVVTL